MVVFNCGMCGDALKKSRVEKHSFSCSRKTQFSCVDCGKDFDITTYKEHNKCITEMEKYGGKNYVPSQNQNKGEKKQNDWFEIVQSAINTDSCSPACRTLLQRLSDFPNTPRKKQKFMNFVGNSLRGFPLKVVEEGWSILEQSLAKKSSGETNEKSIENSTINGDDIATSNNRECEMNSKKKTKKNNVLENDKSEIEKEKDVRSRKRKADDTVNENEKNLSEENSKQMKLEGTETSAESPNQKLKVINIIKEILTSTETHEMSLKKLRKKVKKTCKKNTSEIDDEKIVSKIDKALKKPCFQNCDGNIKLILV